MAPLFRHWDGLNHIYGVVEVIRDLTKDLKAVLEFEPGLYSHTQVKESKNCTGWSWWFDTWVGLTSIYSARR